MDHSVTRHKNKFFKGLATFLGRLPTCATKSIIFDSKSNTSTYSVLALKQNKFEHLKQRLIWNLIYARYGLLFYWVVLGFLKMFFFECSGKLLAEFFWKIVVQGSLSLGKLHKQGQKMFCKKSQTVPPAPFVVHSTLDQNMQILSKRQKSNISWANDLLFFPIFTNNRGVIFLPSKLF